MNKPKRSLNIDTFNEIIEKAAKDDVSKIEILEAELSIASEVFFTELGILLDELVENGYESKQFTKIQNIKANTNHLLTQIDELKANQEAEE